MGAVPSAGDVNASCDLLIHEVFATSAQLAALPQMKPVADHHTSPEQAGAVFHV
jgi:ribonuclease BN (tRNA processing enzyme)